MQRQEAAMLNALQLAYIGDCVWETVIRGMLVQRGLNVKHMHQSCVQYVNAHAQAEWLQIIDSSLEPAEKEIVHRGRNAHAHQSAPKNQLLSDYSAATGFEALIGYLYLTGDEDRILFLSKMIIKGESFNG